MTNIRLRVTIEFWDDEKPLVIDTPYVRAEVQTDSYDEERLFMVIEDHSTYSAMDGVVTHVALDVVKSFKVDIIE